MALASFLSLTPSLSLDFFFMGSFSERKLVSISGAFPELVLLMTSRATAEDSKGRKSLRWAI
jgi:hypothetical protein